MCGYAEPHHTSNVFSCFSKPSSFMILFNYTCMASSHYFTLRCLPEHIRWVLMIALPPWLSPDFLQLAGDCCCCPIRKSPLGLFPLLQDCELLMSCHQQMCWHVDLLSLLSTNNTATLSRVQWTSTEDSRPWRRKVGKPWTHDQSKVRCAIL